MQASEAVTACGLTSGEHKEEQLSEFLSWIENEKKKKTHEKAS